VWEAKDYSHGNRTFLISINKENTEFTVGVCARQHRDMGQSYCIWGTALLWKICCSPVSDTSPATSVGQLLTGADYEITIRQEAFEHPHLDLTLQHNGEMSKGDISAENIGTV
jgi:hypothetical protein